jgi:Rrf2 family protein
VVSQTVEYALRAVVAIAQLEGQACTAQKIAAITKVPAPYLSKLLQGLVRAGVLRSQRGLHGGFVLTKAATALSIWDVVDAVEPFKRIQTCPLGIGTHGASLCPLHRRLDNAMALVEQSFRATTIAELLGQPGSTSPLCEEQPLMTISLDSVASRATKQKPRKKQKTAKRRAKR